MPYGHSIENIRKDTRKKHQLDRRGQTQEPGEKDFLFDALCRLQPFFQDLDLDIPDLEKTEDEGHENKNRRADKGAFVTQGGSGEAPRGGPINCPMVNEF